MISKVDGEMIDLIRSFEKNIKSSDSFLIYFTSILDDLLK